MSDKISSLLSQQLLSFGRNTHLAFEYTIMRLGQTPLTIFIALVIFQLLFFVTTIFATEEQCHIDCYSFNDRSVGPTRPWDAFDPLRNPLHLTKPYPYHIAANDIDKYDVLKALGYNDYLVKPIESKSITKLID